MLTWPLTWPLGVAAREALKREAQRCSVELQRQCGGRAPERATRRRWRADVDGDVAARGDDVDAGVPSAKGKKRQRDLAPEEEAAEPWKSSAASSISICSLIILLQTLIIIIRPTIHQQQHANDNGDGR